MRLAFFGSPADAVPALHALVGAGHEIALVVTQPDRRRGRGASTMPSPVRQAAEELGLNFRTPERSREIVDELAALSVQIGVVVAFGQILPDALLATAADGFVNLHFSLLPRWRGAAPVERAILAGDSETGVCVMEVVHELDAGGVYASATVPIHASDTAGGLHDRLVDVGTDLLVRTLPAVPSTVPLPQSGEVTYAQKLTVDEFRLLPQSHAVVLERLVRAGNPKPGAWFTVGGRRVKVLGATAKPRPDTLDRVPAASPGGLDRSEGALVAHDGLLVLDVVQPEGKQPMAGPAWFAGVRATAIDPA